jgi:hypothetical protein
MYPTKLGHCICTTGMYEMILTGHFAYGMMMVTVKSATKNLLKVCRISALL